MALASIGLILIYNISNLKCEFIIKVSGTTLSLVQFSNGKLTGIWDGKLWIYEIKQNSYSCISMNENYHFYRVVEIFNNTFVSCGDSIYLNFRSINYPHNILRKITIQKMECFNIMYHIKTKNYLSISSNINLIIQFWDLESYKCIASTKRHFFCYINAILENKK